MKKVICLFVLIMLQLNSLFCLSIARLHYDGGGDWYNNPDMLPNLAVFINNELNTDISEDLVNITPSSAELFDYPFIFMTGHGNISFSDNDVRNLKKYFKNGGFLYADDDYGMDKSFRREIAKVFPGTNMVELPANHEIFNCYYKFPKGLPKTHKHDDKRPVALAIFDDNGRMQVLYTYESNISDGWASARVHNDPQIVREKALKMGLNIFYYMMVK